jgi:hypothetical protein
VHGYVGRLCQAGTGIRPASADFVRPFPHRQASARSGRRVEGERDEAAEWRTENHLQEDPVAVAEESLESDQRSERAAIHAGALEYADCRAYYLKESFQLFWDYRQPKRAEERLHKWMNSAMRSRLEPIKKFVRMLRSHPDGILPWTKLRLSNGGVEEMNNKIKSISGDTSGLRGLRLRCCLRTCAVMPRLSDNPPSLDRLGFSSSSHDRTLRSMTMLVSSHQVVEVPTTSTEWPLDFRAAFLCITRKSGLAHRVERHFTQCAHVSDIRPWQTERRSSARSRDGISSNGESISSPKRWVFRRNSPFKSCAARWAPTCRSTGR